MTTKETTSKGLLDTATGILELMDPVVPGTDEITLGTKARILEDYKIQSQSIASYERSEKTTRIIIKSLMEENGMPLNDFINKKITKQK